MSRLEIEFAWVRSDERGRELAIASRALRVNTLRSALTELGIVVGVGAEV
jgi:hypothetical protein